MNITKEQFIEYEKVRQSGVTNMFDIKTVSKIADLNKEQCLAIMNQYSKLKAKYLRAINKGE